jgi:hypothetical protein
MSVSLIFPLGCIISESGENIVTDWIRLDEMLMIHGCGMLATRFLIPAVAMLVRTFVADNAENRKTPEKTFIAQRVKAHSIVSQSP